MPELRLDISSREWVIIAPERAGRPEDYVRSGRLLTHQRPAHRKDCPFCPGQEENTLGETLCLSDAQGNWRVRAFPNRYPALLPIQRLPGRKGGLYQRRMQGFGRHEVICESNLHNVSLALLSPPEVGDVLRAWRQRYRAQVRQAGVEHVVIFKNHGPSAGTSLEHPHSQIVALPVTPRQVSLRLEEASRFYNEMGRCVFCRMVEREIEDGERIVCQGNSFTAFVPFAAHSPFALWVVPHRHNHSFSEATDQELMDLSEVLQTVLSKLYYGLGDPDFNMVLRSAHPEALGSRVYHYYFGIFPRLSAVAGFEVGTGMYINPSLPENDAAFLRDLKAPPVQRHSSAVTQMTLAQSEMVDIVDEQNHVFGEATRSAMREQNLLHRSVAIMCTNSAGEVYVQQRTSSKDLFASMYSMMVTGVVMKGESYAEAAARELKEELSVTAPLEFLFSHLFQCTVTRAWVQVYKVCWDMKISHDAEEVQWGSWIPEADLSDWYQRVPVVPDSLDCFLRYKQWLKQGRPPSPHWT